jgi:hypothetical protein
MLDQSSIHASERPPVDAYDSSNDNAPDDDLAAFRGIVVSVCLGIAVWIVIGAVVWGVFRG